MKKILIIIAIALLPACSSSRLTYFDTITLAEQPITPGTFSIQTSKDDFDTFYEKFIAKNLIARLKKRGWIYSEHNPEYVLKITLGANTMTRAVSSAHSTNMYDVIINKYVNVSLYKKDDLIFKTYIEDNDINGNIALSDLVIPIIDKELKTKNAYQRHIYNCEIKDSDDNGHISANCYLDEERTETETLDAIKTKIIPNPYL